MAINTIDGFYIGSATPIDTRITAADSTERTSIVYKYDGLKVLQLDTRENWIWNQGISAWELDSNAIDISGIENSLSKFKSGSGLTHSAVYNIGTNKVGIHTSSPNSVFQINGMSGDNFNIYLDSTNGVMMSTNWYYHFDASSGVYTSAKDSVHLKLTVDGGVAILSREANDAVGAFTKYFEVHDANNFNYLRSPGSGTFISGSASFGTGTSPYATQQLVYVDGSVRTHSSLFKGIVWIFFNGFNFYRRRSYSTNGSVPSGNTLIGTSYTIANYENEIVIHSTSDALDANLPALSGSDSHDLGREITITLEGAAGAILNVSAGSTDIIDLNGDIYLPAIGRGDSIKFMSVATDGGVRWKTMSHISASTDYPEAWKYIGNPGTMMNGESIPDFNGNDHVENSGMPNKTNVRLRKIDEKHIHIQGVMLVKDYSPLAYNEYEMDLFRLPAGYRPLYDIFKDALIHSDPGNFDDYYAPGQYKIMGTGFCRFYFYDNHIISPNKSDSYITIDMIIPID